MLSKNPQNQALGDEPEYLPAGACVLPPLSNAREAHAVWKGP